MFWKRKRKNKISEELSLNFLLNVDREGVSETWKFFHEKLGREKDILIFIEAGRRILLDMIEKHSSSADASEQFRATGSALKSKLAYWDYLYQYVVRELYGETDDAGERAEGSDGLVYTSDGTILLSCADRDMRVCNVRPGTKAVAANAFRGAERLCSVTFPEGLEYIGECAMAECRKLKSVVFSGTGPLHIDDSAFALCTSLREADIPEGVSFLRNGVFDGCRALRKVNLPASLFLIGKYVFRGTALKSVVLPENLVSVTGAAFCGCGSVKIVNRSAVLKKRDGFLVTGDVLVMPLDFTATRPVIPSFVTRIGTDAFMHTNIRELVFPSGVSLVGTGVCAWCESLLSAVFPETVRLVPAGSFVGCTSLESVVFGRGTAYIDDGALSGCDSLKNVTCLAQDPPGLGADVFEGTDLSSCALRVPASSVIKYKRAPVWKDFGSVAAI